MLGHVSHRKSELRLSRVQVVDGIHILIGAANRLIGDRFLPVSHQTFSAD